MASSAAAAAGSAAAAAVAAAAAPTLSATVRRLLVDAGNRPVRVNALWEAVRAQPSAASTSKTHFKRRILGQMLVRDEVRGRGRGAPSHLSCHARARTDSPPHPRTPPTLPRPAAGEAARARGAHDGQGLCWLAAGPRRRQRSLLRQPSLRVPPQGLCQGECAAEAAGPARHSRGRQAPHGSRDGSISSSRGSGGSPRSGSSRAPLEMRGLACGARGRQKRPTRCRRVTSF